MMDNLQKIACLRDKVFEQSNDHCFIERERFLNALHECTEHPTDYYVRILSDMLDCVSTPIDDCDIFVGRVLEGAPEQTWAECPNRTLFAKAHLTPDYARLLTLGYRGILAQIKENEKRIGTEESHIYARNAEVAINAIRRFALRYAEAAKEKGMQRAYEALLRVPYEPAYDLYSALQGIWLVHMIASCYVGGRDYAFGYMDEYLYPYYLKEKERGATDAEIAEMFAGFFVKPNEICGRHPHNYRQKPVLCQSAKQYVLLDGGRANRLSEVILEGAKLNSMVQPEFTVVLSKNSPKDFCDKVFEAMSVLVDKLQVYNCESVMSFLRSKGLPEEIALRPGFSACCTSDIYLHSCREEFYLPTVPLFCDTLFGGEFSSKEELLSAFAAAVTKECEGYLCESRYPDRDWVRCVFVIDSLLLGTCNEVCDYIPYGLTYRAKNIFLPGIATLGDSLCALDKLVFNGDIPYSEFIRMLKADFIGFENVYERIAALPKFGNDNAEDSYTIEMAEALIGAIESAEHTEREVLLPSFYSLERENVWAESIPATPDGRRAGKPFSENQSPVYGADRKGITALLNSLSKLPFEKTAAGGLNLNFSSKVEPSILQALCKTYFERGGLHIGMTVLDRETLKDAMAHPEKYKTLTVRMYGFSEYFVSLAEWQQLAVLNRTVY
ncbi:MAG: hypothetical protein IJ011_03580 [Clostridia bacterium]|nr:hypothetical protein [Clostridia bacterium]